MNPDRHTLILGTNEGHHIPGRCWGIGIRHTGDVGKPALRRSIAPCGDGFFVLEAGFPQVNMHIHPSDGNEGARKVDHVLCFPLRR